MQELLYNLDLNIVKRTYTVSTVLLASAEGFALRQNRKHLNSALHQYSFYITWMEEGYAVV